MVGDIWVSQTIGFYLAGYKGLHALSAFIEKQTNLNYRIQVHNKSCAAGLADLSPRMSENKGQKAGDHEQQGGGHVGKIEHDQRGHGEMNPGQVFHDHKDPRGQSHSQDDD